jgi:lysine 6-dehydrogenase
VRIYVGGLPQKPRPPLSYKLVFNIEGLIDLYVSRACVLREGQITQLEPLTELEEVDFPAPVGRCEACITSGGVSTCPWTFQDQLLRYEEKTVRYPGHFAKIKTLMDLGLLSAEPIAIGGVTVTPRELFGKVVAPRIDFPKDRDLLVLRVSCTGERDGQPCAVVYDLLDFHEEKTGFSAMERTTGFSAAIVASLLAQGKARKGAIPLETALSSDAFVAELARRDFRIAETVQLPLAPTQ